MNYALPIIEEFGGTTAMARALGAPITTVQSWKERNAIPCERLPAILAAAETEGISQTKVLDLLLQGWGIPRDCIIDLVIHDWGIRPENHQRLAS